jgi:hypothetical protein
MRIMNALLCTRLLVADPIETLQRLSRISLPPGGASSIELAYSLKLITSGVLGSANARSNLTIASNITAMTSIISTIALSRRR